MRKDSTEEDSSLSSQLIQDAEMGGGRLLCELTDCGPDQVEIGMPLKMTLRKLADGDGIVNYFWEARPAEK